MFDLVTFPALWVWIFLLWFCLILHIEQAHGEKATVNDSSGWHKKKENKPLQGCRVFAAKRMEMYICTYIWYAYVAAGKKWMRHNRSLFCKDLKSFGESQQVWKRHVSFYLAYTYIYMYVWNCFYIKIQQLKIEPQQILKSHCDLRTVVNSSLKRVSFLNIRATAIRL